MLCVAVSRSGGSRCRISATCPSFLRWTVRRRSPFVTSSHSCWRQPLSSRGGLQSTRAPHWRFLSFWVVHGDDGEDPPDLSEATSGTVFTTTYAVVRFIQVSIPSSFTASMPGGTRVSVVEPQEWWYCWSSFLRYCDLCLRPRLSPSRVRTRLGPFFFCAPMS